MLYFTCKSATSAVSDIIYASMIDSTTVPFDDFYDTTVFLL